MYKKLAFVKVIWILILVKLSSAFSKHDVI
jgi:hypothetical protein